MPQKKFDGPIPGANFTSDTRNYPWHRPPELHNYDAVVDYYMEKINEEETQDLVLSLLEMKIPLTAVVSMMLKQGIGKGKLGIDMAILTAGPIARYLSIIADEQNIKYRTGIEKRKIKVTPALLRAALGQIEKADQSDEEKTSEDMTEETMGLMQRPGPADIPAAPAEEQAQMLGEEPKDELA